MSLKQFLVDLATKADVKRGYAEDPDGTMAAAGLTAEERAALASGDSAMVRMALGKPDNDCNSQIGEPVPIGSKVTRPQMETINVKADKLLVDKKDGELLEKIKKRKRSKKAGPARGRKKR